MCQEHPGDVVIYGEGHVTVRLSVERKDGFLT